MFNRLINFFRKKTKLSVCYECGLSAGIVKLYSVTIILNPGNDTYAFAEGEDLVKNHDRITVVEFCGSCLKGLGFGEKQ